MDMTQRQSTDSGDRVPPSTGLRGEGSRPAPCGNGDTHVTITDGIRRPRDVPVGPHQDRLRQARRGVRRTGNDAHPVVKNAGSSNNASIRANSSGNFSSSGGSTASYSDT